MYYALSSSHIEYCAVPRHKPCTSAHAHSLAVAELKRTEVLKWLLLARDTALSLPMVIY